MADTPQTDSAIPVTVDETVELKPLDVTPVPEKAAEKAPAPVSIAETAPSTDKTDVDVAPSDRKGTAKAGFTMHYRGCVMNYRKGDAIVAHPAMYTYLAGCPVDWQD